MTAAGLLSVEKCKAAFKHVVTTVFGLPMDSNIWKAFVFDMGSEDLLNIYRLTGMAPIDVAELDFKPNNWANGTVPLSTPPPMMTPWLYGQQLTMDSTKNVKVLHFDQGPPKVLVLSCSSLEHLPFDHGPNQVLMLCQVNENLTLKVIHHLNIHLALDPNSKNIHLEPLNEEPPVVMKSLQKTFQDLSSTLLDHGETNAPMQSSNDNADASTNAIIDLQDLVGCTFLMEKHAD